MKGVRTEAVKLQKELRDAQRLNKTLTDQLKETRKSAEEIGRVQRELREAKMMNDQLGKQLAELLNHSAKMKSQMEKLRHELQEKDKVIETLQLRLQSKADMHSIALSPFSSPPRRFVETQTSPGLSAKSSLQSPRASSPQRESSSEATEKLHQINRMLLGENQLLRGKLKDSEKLNDTLRNENNLFSRIHNQSTQTQAATSQKRSTTDELLAGFMAEMRELRLRLEDSIRTNDALRAQLEMRLSEGTGDGSAASVPDQIILIRENDTLRTELLEKDRANEKLKRAMDGLKQEQTKDKEQINLLRQQLLESSKVSENLRKELSVYEKLYKLSEGRNMEVQTESQSYGSEGPRSPNSELQHDAMSMLLAEIRSLRVQLEKSIQTNNALRLKLEEQLSRPLSSPSQSPSRSQVTVIRQLNFSEGKGGDDAGSIGSVRDLENGRTPVENQQVVDELEEKLNAINKFASEAYNSVISNSQTDSLPYIENILRIILECKTLLNALHNQSLKLEIGKLRRRLLIQEDIIKRACERLENTNKVKEGTRAEVIEQLSQSQKVLSGARGKLENRVRSRKTNK
ncbi:CDK5 regulatory subunit associated protein 2 [Desmophyllum pertusum]|uniref:CDK5 regulatory subunit associated protein 2 n=1 Tax=Desmophyllum pertusum TaxID=174260 RepID=A0A9W9YFD3_9CNID|nr:CDK5 regulatory subunit associated protein 2 [Desmophyllum pertusum]